MQKSGLIIALIMTLVLIPLVNAQTGGQFCVRSFEDTNANGILDPDETLLTRGVSVDLLDASNVVVASALLDTSPNANSGVICFQNLQNSQYSVMMSSAEYRATSPMLVSQQVSDGTVPSVVEFGAQRITMPVPTTSDTATSPIAQLLDVTPTRLITAGLGTLIILALMFVIGLVVYAILVRRGRRPAPINYSPASVRFMDPIINEPPPSLIDTNPVQPPKLNE